MTRPSLRTRFACCLLVALGGAGCERDAPEPPDVPPGQVENVTGAERLGWTQAATDNRELATFRYAVYVDNTRGELTGTTCQPPASPTSSAFDCTAPLPPLSPGAHSIELATFTDSGTGPVESARSAQLTVNKTSGATAVQPRPRTTSQSGITTRTTDGLQLRIDRITNVVDATDIAFAPDGRLFVAEQAGHVRILTPDGRTLAESSASDPRRSADDTRLISLALDSRFAETHFVYTVSIDMSRRDRPLFILARSRESSNTLVDRIVLRDDVPASAIDPAASVRGSADGKLFVAFDDGGDARKSSDPASPNGKIFRLNPDGSTPDDQAGRTPMFFAGLRLPAGFDWRPATGILWIADRVGAATGQLSAIDSVADGRRNGRRLRSYRLPTGSAPASLAFYRGDAIPAFRNNLLVASHQGKHLLRMRFDPLDDMKVVSVERLFQDAIGGVRLVGVSPNGTVYLSTTDAIARLAVVGL